MPILNESELDWLCDNVPDAPRSPKGGRPPADKRLMLQAIFWVLDNGAKWKDLPGKLGSKSTAHRWFRTWAQAGVFEELMNVAGLCIEEKGGFKLYVCFIDGTFSKAKGGGDGIGATKVGKGVKLMIMVDAKGLPVAACTSAAGPHESRSVQELFDFMITTQKPGGECHTGCTPIASLPPPLEGGAHHCLAATLPSSLYSMGEILAPFPRLCSFCLHHAPTQRGFGIGYSATGRDCGMARQEDSSWHRVGSRDRSPI